MSSKSSKILCDGWWIVQITMRFERCVMLWKTLVSSRAAELSMELVGSSRTSIAGCFAKASQGSKAMLCSARPHAIITPTFHSFRLLPFSMRQFRPTLGVRPNLAGFRPYYGGVDQIWAELCQIRKEIGQNVAMMTESRGGSTDRYT